MKSESHEIGYNQHQFIVKEARLARGKTCKCCRKYMDELGFALFQLRERSQWVVVGFQCSDCERAGRTIWYTHTDKTGTPLRMYLRDGEWVLHALVPDEFGGRDEEVWTVDDCDTADEAVEQWNRKLERDLE